MIFKQLAYGTVALLVGSVSAYAAASGAGLHMDARIVANDRDGVYVLQAHNTTQEAITLAWPYQPDLMKYRLLHEEPGVPGWRRQHPKASSLRGNLTIPAGERMYHRYERFSHILWMPELANAYSAWRWGYRLSSPPTDLEISGPPTFYLGYVSVGGRELTTPYAPPDSGVSNLLAFVFFENRIRNSIVADAPPHELAFLLLNGTAEPLEIAPPLSAESILHVSAPGIGFSAEITLADSGFEASTVEPGECGQWRIPFERILAQMPAETVEAIRAANGAFDVVWKSGDRESPPLPLILLPPTQAERDAAFLAEHADVPRIDEHTDLSLDLRLAGIEGEPVLLGRFLNDEPHRVMVDRSLRHSMLISTLDSHPFHREGRHGPLYTVEPGQVVNFWAPLQSLVPEIPKDEPTGRLICFQWTSVLNFSQAIWLVFGGEHNRIERIHTFEEKYLPISEYYRPDLPPIAPLLAYVHNSETPPELTCVLWNRTEVALQVADSLIIASAPAADYRRELALPDELALPATVAPGTHTDWRIPWQVIMDQLPPNDLARIKAVGGELDLIWHVNGLDSPPLPILLGWDGQAE